jgi:hypothetical protein
MFNKVTSRSWLLLQILILFLVEKWNPPTRSKTAEIGQKKPEGILGVKPSIQLQGKKGKKPYQLAIACKDII